MSRERSTSGISDVQRDAQGRVQAASEQRQGLGKVHIGGAAAERRVARGPEAPQAQHSGRHEIGRSKEQRGLDKGVYQLPDGRQLVFDGAKDTWIAGLAIDTHSALTEKEQALVRAGMAPNEAKGRVKADVWNTISTLVDQRLPYNPAAEQAVFASGQRQAAGNLVDRGADWQARTLAAGWIAEQLTKSASQFLSGEVRVAMGSADGEEHPFIAYTSGDGKNMHVYDARYGINAWVSQMDDRAQEYYTHYANQQNSNS